MLDEYLIVPRSAVDWLMRYKPVLCEKSGLDKATTVPIGLQLVPQEPTGDMLNAAWNAAQVGRSPQEDRAVWKAMLAAAPKTPNVK